MLEGNHFTKGDGIVVRKENRVKGSLPAKRPNKQRERELENGFIELYRQGGVSIFEAAKQLGTTYETARKYYHKCASIIADANRMNDETHFQRRDRVMDMAMESLTQKIRKARATEKRLALLLAIEYGNFSNTKDKGRKLLESIEDAKIEEPDNLKVIKMLEDEIEKGVSAFQATTQTILNIEEKYRQTQQMIVELTEKYNVIELKPSSQAILEAELGRYLDDKEERQQHQHD